MEKDKKDHPDEMLEIKFDDELVRANDYDRIHPLTQQFIDRFGLDDRLYRPRQMQQQNHDYNPY